MIVTAYDIFMYGAPRRKRFEAVLGLDEKLRLEMSLKTTGEIVDR